MNFSKKYYDCSVNFENSILTIENSKLKRQWEINDKIIPVLLLCKSSNIQWLTQTDKEMWNKAGNKRNSFYKNGLSQSNITFVDISVNTCDDFGISEEYMLTSITFKTESFNFKWNLIIYPNTAILRSYLNFELLNLSSAKCVVSDSSEENLELQQLNHDIIFDDCVDFLPIDNIHCKWKQTEFFDRTDSHNTLTQSKSATFYCNEHHELAGNVLEIDDIFSDNSLVLIKEGPCKEAYIGEQNSDFIIDGSNIYVTGFGFTVDELVKYKKLSTYPSTIILCNKDSFSKSLAFNNYNIHIHKFIPEKDATILSNTWGDRSKDSKLCEEFILKEIEKASQLGITHCQIDDGWQKGTTTNSINKGKAWGSYYKHQPDFWDTNPERFPNDFYPLLKYANQKNVNIALWFSPDSDDDYANFEKDSQKIVELYNKFNIKVFKIDGVKIRTKKGEENFIKLLELCVEKSNNNICFNLDTTAEIRLGYFGKTIFGNIFLENRYTDWGRYFPSWSLRNLWHLSSFISSFKIQLEFLNTSRNKHLFKNDPNSAYKAGIEYAFATTMFSNPLAWCELTELDKESLEILSNVIRVYKEHHVKILSSVVIPIGDEPLGNSFTGFQGYINNDSGYLLCFKENTKNNNFDYILNNVSTENLNFTQVLGYGKVDICNEKVRYYVDDIFKYGLFYYERKIL